MIKICRTSIDGCRSVRQFKTIINARKYAYDCVGPQDAFGIATAVAGDGVVKITWAGCTRQELFARTTTAKLNEYTTFYARGNDLFCRQAGYTYDHERQQFGRVVEVNGFWKLRHNVGESPILFDEEATYSTRETALAAAKNGFLTFLAHLENDVA